MAHRLLSINLILIFLLIGGAGWGQTGASAGRQTGRQIAGGDLDVRKSWPLGGRAEEPAGRKVGAEAADAGKTSADGKAGTNAGRTMDYAADSVFLRRLADEVLVNSQAYENLEVLTKEVGPRLSGSPGYYKAEVWGKRALEASLDIPYDDPKDAAEKMMIKLQTRIDSAKGKLWGDLVNVRMQECMVPHWVRVDRAEARKAEIVVRADHGADSASWSMNGSGAAGKKGMNHGMDVLALGNSVGTGPKGIRARLILIHNFEELEERKDEVKGKIVFYSYAFDPRFVETFNAYGDAVKYRVMGPSLAAKYGAVAVIVRSMSHSVDNNPHTGALIYNDSFPKIPAVAVGLRDADALAGALESAAAEKKYMEDKTTGKAGAMKNGGKDSDEAGSAAGTEVWGYVRTLATMLPDTIAHNVIGEIKGSEFPNEYITVGGHLDSWDPAEGAMDDGTGCVQAIEVLRALKAMGYKPRHTIRAVLFANEENGGRGGAKYAEEAKAHGEKHLLGLESDNGGFTPRAFTFSLSDERLAAIQPWVKLLEPYGVYELIKGGGGSDVSHLQQVMGAVVGELRPDSQRYFDYHHSRGDVLSVVNKRELELGALNMAAIVYLIDKYGF